VPVASLIAWITTVLGGLFLLAIWLIEYDPDFQRAAATRLPVPVISTHALLALGGLGVWVGYLITDDDMLAYITIADLAVVVSFGLIMAVRWIGVYRSRALPPRSSLTATPAAYGGAQSWQLGSRRDAAVAELVVPPERHFPLVVVVGHGLFATATVTLVLLTTFGAVTGS
jgi:hypothetical protein